MRLSILAVSALLTGLTRFASAGPVQWSSAAGGNDHYYEFVSTLTCNRPNGYDCLNWNQALDAAATHTYMGMQGYLATVTTFEEDIFIKTNSGVGNFHAWLAGSDEGDDGKFTWRAGPETGVPFMQVDYDMNLFNCLQAWCDPDAFALRYVRLSSETNYLMTGIGLEWNLNTVDDHFPGFPNASFGRPLAGYIVEYGGDTPEPGTLPLLAAGLAAVLIRKRGAA